VVDISTVGIVANPASGKDTRSLVSRASVFDNHERTHILEGILLALDVLGVERIFYVPDYYGLTDHALCRLRLSLEGTKLPMTMWADERDSNEAARRSCM
jgi:predicted polyphosphate/ATP-dependent NAD kinase